MKNIIRILFGIPVILSVPTPPKVPVDILLEGLAIHTDKEGCCESCGYSYCPSLDNCVKPWETYGIILPPK